MYLDPVEEVREFLSANRLLRKGATVGRNDSLLATGIIDSLAVMALVGFLEERFKIQIPEDALVPENFDSLDSIVRLVAAPGR
jgi:acyl carrier protein